MKTTDYNQQASQFLSRNGIRFSFKLLPWKLAPWATGEDCGNRYRTTLAKGSKRLAIEFWGSIADKEAGITQVSPYDVLACLSGDANCPETFKDFCAEFGYDSDSIKALATFRRCAKLAKRLRAFFTAKELNQLTEIS